MASVADEKVLSGGRDRDSPVETSTMDGEAGTTRLTAAPFGMLGPEHLPDGGLRYWVALCLAGILGSNTGDLLASAFGSLSGLPLLVAAYAVLMALVQDGEYRTEAYYWLPIVVVQTAATNLADFAGHRFGVPAALLIPALLLLGLAAAQRYLDGRGRAHRPVGKDAREVGRLTWAMMLAAGTLGTAIGDLASLRSGLGSASLLLSGIAALLIGLKARPSLAAPAPYWLAVVAVRAAGTAVADVFAEHAGLWPSAIGSLILLGAVLALPPRVWRTLMGRPTR